MELNRDEMMMAEGIVRSMIKDGVATNFLEGAPCLQKELMLAYFAVEIKKFEKFQTKTMTNPEAKKAFVEFVLAII